MEFTLNEDELKCEENSGEYRMICNENQVSLLILIKTPGMPVIEKNLQGQ